MSPDGKSAQEDRPDILIAVEDPGAANFMLELPEAFLAAGLSCRVVAYGHAPEFLRTRCVPFAEPGPEIGPAEMLNAHMPRLLLAGTSQNLASPVLEFMDEMSKRGGCVAAFVDMAADAELRFKGLTSDPLAHAPGWLFVADSATEEAFLDLGYPARNVLRCGHPAHDRVRRQARELAGRDRSALCRKVLGHNPAPRPVWTFATEYSGDDPRQRRDASYTLHGRGGSDRREDIVLEEVLEARANVQPNPFLVLRLHPKNQREEFAAYLPEIDLVSQGGDPLELLWVSDLVLGMSSMLLMEATLAGRPTLSILPRECERAWGPSALSGLTPFVTSRQALWDALDGGISSPAEVAMPDAVTLVREKVLELLGRKPGTSVATSTPAKDEGA